MREIKFRYRHKSKKSDFVAVDLVTIEELYRGAYMAGLSDQNHWELLSRDEYTGLKDKNGKEIYEGDVVQWRADGMNKVASVVWHECGYEFHWAKYRPPVRFEFQQFCEWSSLEVIGNIYENPDLLQK